jgi:histidine ammonia-lyase
MGAAAALLCRRVLANVEHVVGIELLCGAQALDLRLASMGAPVVPGAGVAIALERVRARIAHLDGDRELGPDLAAAVGLVRSGSLADLVA